MLNLADDREDRCPALRMYGVLVKFRSVRNFSFSVDKTKWGVIDFSKQCTNRSPITTEGTTAQPPSNFQQRHLQVFCFGKLYVQEKQQLKDFSFQWHHLNNVLANIRGRTVRCFKSCMAFKKHSTHQLINAAFPIPKCYSTVCFMLEINFPYLGELPI